MNPGSINFVAVSVALVAGGIAGTAASLVLGGRSSPAPERVVEVRHQIERVRVVEESEPPPRTAPQPPPVEAPRTPQGAPSFGDQHAAPPTAEESRVEHAARNERYLSMHAAETYDAAWSRATSETLRSGIASALGSGLASRIANIDCRSVSCVTAIESPDYPTAVGEYRRIVMEVQHTQRELAQHCGPWVVLPEPQDRTAAYTTNIIWACDRGDPIAGR